MRLEDTIAVSNRTYQALENLYLNSLEMQKEEFAIEQRKRDKLAHAKEFGTIKICGPRRSGHTHSIMRFLERISHPLTIKQEVALVFYRRVHSVRFSELFQEFCLQKNIVIKNVNQSVIELNNGSKVLLFSTNSIGSIAGISLDTIIVDCTSLIKPSKIDEIYRFGLPCMEFKPYVSFIFLE